LKNKKTETEKLPPAVIRKKGSLFTVSTYGKGVYGEKILAFDGKYLRQWVPRRSKLGSALSKGNFPLKIERDWNVLYLGASTGTTVSHISDIVTDGSIFAVEFAPEPFQKLLSLSEQRTNIFPILEDSRSPERYSFFIDRKIDLIYQDVSQRDQLDIFKRNLDTFQDWEQAVLVLKLRSISSRADLSETLDDALEGLSDFFIRKKIDLSPVHKSHYMILLERK